MVIAIKEKKVIAIKEINGRSSLFFTLFISYVTAPFSDRFVSWLQSSLAVAYGCLSSAKDLPRDDRRLRWLLLFPPYLLINLVTPLVVLFIQFSRQWSRTFAIATTLHFPPKRRFYFPFQLYLLFLNLRSMMEELCRFEMGFRCYFLR